MVARKFSADCRASSPMPRRARRPCSSAQAARARRRTSPARSSILRPDSKMLCRMRCAPAMQDLIAGRIDICVDTPVALPQIESGTVKPIAVLTRSRSPSLPTLASARGRLAGFAASNWARCSFPRRRHRSSPSSDEPRPRWYPSLQAQMKKIADLVRRSPVACQSAGLCRERDREVGGPDQGGGLHADPSRPK